MGTWGASWKFKEVYRPKHPTLSGIQPTGFSRYCTWEQRQSSKKGRQIADVRGNLWQPPKSPPCVFLKSSRDEFKQMCLQEVLGLSDEAVVQGLFQEDFKSQLQRLNDGTYSTRLPWKSGHAPLLSNKELTLRRLQSTTQKLERMQKLEEYHTVMEQQLEERILELVP